MFGFPDRAAAMEAMAEATAAALGMTISASPANRRRLIPCFHKQITDHKLCLLCGRPTVELKYIHQDCRLSKDQIARYRRVDLKKTMAEKKLNLILDLDHTLLHTIHLRQLHTRDMEQILSSDPNNFILCGERGTVTKLRPFLSDFLNEAGELFQLCIFTMGSRDYAKRMAKLIDPDGSLFEWRVISREDCTVKGKKGLDIVLADEKGVLIVDDSASVWSNHERSLINVDGFRFFRLHNLREEIESGDCGLSNVLYLLKRIHAMFFDPKIDATPIIDRDVRDYLKLALKEKEKEKEKLRKTKTKRFHIIKCLCMLFNFD